MAAIFAGVALVFIAQNLVLKLAHGQPIEPRWTIFHEALYWAAWGVLSVPTFFLTARWRPGASDRTAWIRLAALGLAVAPLQVALAYGLHAAQLTISGALTDPAGWLGERRAEMVVYAVAGYVQYWIIVGLYLGYDAARRYAGARRKSAEMAARAAVLDSQLTDAKLAALTAQLRPHFLFNTLNSVAVLIDEEPPAARSMLLRLSDLLRRILESGDAQYLSLGEELKAVEDYLAIQRLRFHDRLRVRVDVPDALSGVLVPRWLLQPLVENAVRYGVERREAPTEIRIEAERAGGVLVLQVCDDGPGAGNPGPAAGRGMGLTHTRARLQHLYPGAYAFHAGNRDEGGFLVRIEVPWRPADRGEA